MRNRLEQSMIHSAHSSASARWSGTSTRPRWMLRLPSETTGKTDLGGEPAKGELTLQALRCIHAVRPQPPTNIQAAACLCRQILSYDGTMMASLKSSPAPKGLSRTCVEMRGMRIYSHFRSPGCCIFRIDMNAQLPVSRGRLGYLKQADSPAYASSL